jgi:hypothetical protein
MPRHFLTQSTRSHKFAEAASQMLAQHYTSTSRSSASITDMDGLYHFAPGGVLTTSYGFANKILDGI